MNTAGPTARTSPVLNHRQEWYYGCWELGEDTVIRKVDIVLLCGGGIFRTWVVVVVVVTQP